MSSGEAPLNDNQRRLLAEFQNRGLIYVVTGIVALRLHAYAADVATPPSFSPRGYPAMEVALEPGQSNLERGLRALRELANRKLVHQVSHPIPARKPTDGRTANMVLLESGAPGTPLSPALISYGTTDIDSYPQNRVDPRRVAVGELEIPVSPLFETAAVAHRKIEASMATNQVGQRGRSILNELTDFVKAINRAHEA